MLSGPKTQTNSKTRAQAVAGCFRHQVLLRGCGQWFRCGRERVARPSEQENLDLQPQRNRRRQEDVSKGEPSRGQTGLHSRCAFYLFIRQPHGSEVSPAATKYPGFCADSKGV